MSEPNEVNVLFGGICTHISPLAEGDTAHTVLVNASNGMTLLGNNIPPHSALLRIDPCFILQAPKEIPGLTAISGEEPGAWLMNGVALQILNCQKGVTFGPYFSRIPSLSTAIGGVKLELDPRVVQDGTAACRFDATGGHYDAFKVQELDDAVHVHLTVPLMDATPPILLITRIWDNAGAAIVLRADSEGTPPWIRLFNIGTNTDATIDFALHYGVTTITPSVFPKFTVCGIPDGSSEELKQLGFTKRPIAMQLTLGCSNAGFP